MGWGEDWSPHLSFQGENFFFLLPSPPNTLTSLGGMTRMKLRLSLATSITNYLWRGLGKSVLAGMWCLLSPILWLAFNLHILPCSFWMKPDLSGTSRCFNHIALCERGQEFTFIFKSVSWILCKSSLENIVRVQYFRGVFLCWKGFSIHSAVCK